MESRQIKRAVCPHDCPDTCSILTYVEDGRITRIKGDPKHPITRGFLCAKVNKYLERLYNPERVLYPMKKEGNKGEANFRRISWDEALDTISEKFEKVIAEYGPEAILPYSYAGNHGVLGMASMDRRFFNRLGASRLARTICSTAGGLGFSYTVGRNMGADPEGLPASRLIILWGCNALSTNLHLWPFLEEARREGATLVVIDPVKTRTARAADLHFQPRPGTDAALALSLMHVMVEEDLINREYIERHTLGFDALKERLKDYPPDTASRITGIEAQDIRQLACLYAKNRPSFIRLNYGLQRHSNGGMAVRTIACLPALVGDWEMAGGGALLSTSGAFNLNKANHERNELIKGSPRTINMVQLGDILTRLEPPVMALFVYNSNPAVVVPEQAKVLQGLKREDLFIVVHDLFITETARYADIVIPATTVFEHQDLFAPYGHYYLQLNDPVISPLGEAKSNVELFSLLAERMGFSETCFKDTSEDLIDQALDSGHPHLAGITRERLRKEGPVRINTPTRPFLPFANGKFPTPSGKIEFYSMRMEEEGLDPLPSYIPPSEGPEVTPELYRRYPIQLLSISPHHFLNSSFANQNSLIRKEGRPTIGLSLGDAAARGIRDGELVRVYNDRGSCYLYARVGNTVRPGVAVAYKGWWNKDYPGGMGINQTAPSRPSDMGGGATFYTNLVEVEIINQTPCRGGVYETRK